MTRGTDIHELIRTRDRKLEEERYTTGEIRVHNSILAEFDRLVTEPVQFEVKTEVSIQGVPTRGYWDGWMGSINTILETKTGKALWTKERAVDHGQTHFYTCQRLALTALWPRFKLFSASTANGKCVLHDFDVTQDQVDNMIHRIVKFHDWCKSNNYWDKRLSSKQAIEI